MGHKYKNCNKTKTAEKRHDVVLKDMI